MNRTESPFRNVVVMGPPGSGKGTQANLLAAKLNIPHVSTGDLYRQIEKQDTEIGRKVKAYLDKGELVDDETTFELVDRHFGEIKGGFILDGYPRTLPQAEREAVRVDVILYLCVDDSVVVDRMLSREREGEDRAKIEKRLQVYHLQTEPVLDYYRKQGKLKEIDGNGTIPEVFALILTALGLTNG